MRRSVVILAALPALAGCHGRCQQADGYEDADEDGWGSGAGHRCGAATGLVQRSGDCDDSDATVYPGAAEICGDSVANDCGAQPEPRCLQGDREPASASVTFSGVADVGNYGESVALDEGVIVIGSPLEDGWTGVVRVFGIEGELLATLKGEPGEIFGSPVRAGDLTGDHVPDIVGWGHDGARVIPGPFRDAAVADVTLSTVAVHGVAAPGPDVNADGIATLLVTDYRVPADGDGWAFRGATYLYDSPLPTAPQPIDAVMTFQSTRVGAFGSAASPAGDVDGDGREDLLVGGPSFSEPKYHQGMTYLFTDPWTGIAGEEAATASLVGGDSYEQAGIMLGRIGDLDGDGHDDVVVGGSTWWDKYGNGAYPDRWICASVVYGPVSGEIDLGTAADARISVVWQSDCQMGLQELAGADLDADGSADLLLGNAAAPSPDQQHLSGAVYLFYGPIYGAVSNADADAVFYDDQSYAQIGSAVAAGDVNGDGYGDLLLGSAWHEPSGAAWLYLGGP